MRAAVLSELGKPPQVEAFPEPTPGEGEVVIHVSAAALKSVDKQMAAGKHYASPGKLPEVCGTDGVGRLEDGTRVFFGGPRRPYGAMAERTVVRRAQCFPVPEDLDDDTAAAIPNPGVSAWLSLKYIAKLAEGETVLILSATGVTGKLAAQIAKLLGAGRVVAAGRNAQILSTLCEQGADASIRLDLPDQELVEAFRREVARKRFDVVIDYLWGRPTDSHDCQRICRCRRHDSTSGSGRERRTVHHAARCGVAEHVADNPGNGGHPTLGRAHRCVPSSDELCRAGQIADRNRTVRLAEVADAWERNVHGRRLVVIP